MGGGCPLPKVKSTAKLLLGPNQVRGLYRDVVSGYYVFKTGFTLSRKIISPMPQRQGDNMKSHEQLQTVWCCGNNLSSHSIRHLQGHEGTQVSAQIVWFQFFDAQFATGEEVVVEIRQWQQKLCLLPHQPSFYSHFSPWALCRCASHNKTLALFRP